MRKANPQTDAQAAQLRAEGLSYPAIARRLGIGLATAHRAVQRVTGEHRGESPEVAREVEVARLDVIYQHAAEILNSDHPTVSSGRLVRDGGVTVVDPRVKMQALDRMLAVTDRRIRLLGSAGVVLACLVAAADREDRQAQCCGQRGCAAVEQPLGTGVGMWPSRSEVPPMWCGRVALPERPGRGCTLLG